MGVPGMQEQNYQADLLVRRLEDSAKSRRWTDAWKDAASGRLRRV